MIFENNYYWVCSNLGKDLGVDKSDIPNFIIYFNSILNEVIHKTLVPESSIVVRNIFEKNNINNIFEALVVINEINKFEYRDIVDTLYGFLLDYFKTLYSNYTSYLTFLDDILTATMPYVVDKYMVDNNFPDISDVIITDIWNDFKEFNFLNSELKQKLLNALVTYIERLKPTEEEVSNDENTTTEENDE